jgi:5-methylcytosine-specific restriction endonuclease McrA
MPRRACPRGHLRPLDIGRCTVCEHSRDQWRNQHDPARQPSQRWRWKKLRRAVLARDQGCVYANTGDRAGQLQVHHRLPVRLGGTDSLDNLELICRAHHEQIERELRNAITQRGAVF